jgi:hypothetical protein
MRNIPEDNLAYPVLISLNTGSQGSAFQLNTGTSVYLITAKHVLYDNQQNLKGNIATLNLPSRDINEDAITVIQADLAQLDANNNLHFHQNHDVCAFKIADLEPDKDNLRYRKIYTAGITNISNSVSGPVMVNINSTKNLNEILISNDVYLYGYPSSIGLFNSPQFDYNKPLLRKGIIANTYPQQKTIILDCPVYYGNSGGPVVQVTNLGNLIEHSVIGVVSQFIPFVDQWTSSKSGIVNTEMSNSGYSVIVAIDAVREILKI